MLMENVGESLEYLQGDTDLYQRGGELVRIARISETEQHASEDADGKPTIYQNTPTLRSISEGHFTARMAAYVPCQRFDGRLKKYIRCDPPPKLVRAVLAHVEYPNIRYLRGIAETPFMRPDGSICQKPGYDKATGYLYAPSAKFAKVPDQPTQADAKAAFLKLRHVYAGLEFTSEEAMACPIAGILTVFAQAAIRGCTPVFMFEANTPGTGKTIVIDTIGTIISGRPMPRRSFPGPGEELRKVLDSYARDGTRFFCLDNIRQDFGGEALEAAVTTEGRYDIRILGETRKLSIEWKCVIFGTGNNIGFESNDIVPRTLMSRMSTSAEDPRGRDVSTFLIKEDLRVYVARKRAELVQAALTMLRAYAVAGRTKQSNRPWGSFDAFNAWIAPAILYAGGPDITECRITGDKARVADGDTQHLLVVLDRLPALYTNFKVSGGKKIGWMTAASIIDALYSEEHCGHDEQFDVLRSAIESLCSKKRTGFIRPNAQGLGLAFRRCRERVLDGKRLVEQFDSHRGIQLWAVEHVGLLPR